MDLTREEIEVARKVIERMAELAEDLGYSAGVGGVETAGHLVSYLADNSKDIEPCLRFGILELPADWHERGELTWHASDGTVVEPAFARRARIINKLKRAVGA